MAAYLQSETVPPVFSVVVCCRADWAISNKAVWTILPWESAKIPPKKYGQSFFKNVDQINVLMGLNVMNEPHRWDDL